MIRTPSVSMAFKKQTIPQKIVFGQNAHDQLLANAGIFVNPDVPLATLQTVNDTLATTSQEAEGGDHAKVAAMRAAERAWDTTFGTEAEYVDRIANGSEPTILKSGYLATKSQTSPAAIPGTPVVLAAKVNALPGSVHVEVEFQPSVKNLLYFFSTTNIPINFENNEFSFTSNPTVVAFISDAHRKVDFYNLPSGATLYLSVAAQNNAGTSVPSAPVAIKTL